MLPFVCAREWGDAWYLTVSIPDLCLLPYFVCVLVDLPWCAMDWLVIRDCGISWSYSRVK